ncbi:MAG: hypothetical protein HYT37_04080 [Candidatus Sungbacteria bacterium]|nr:hypothetical protein [Candidatus Sungbacteria bacterium]
MHKWTWRQIFLRALLHPLLFIQFLRLPRTYSSLDEWLIIDEQKSEIVVKIIGCRNVESIKSQQRENMQYRKKFIDSFDKWMELVKQPEHSSAIGVISESYMRRELCHRQYRGTEAGVWCYCQ